MTLDLRQIRFTPLRADGSGAPTVLTGYYLIEPTSAYDDGTGRVEVIPFQVDIDAVSVTVDLAVTPTDVAWVWKCSGFFPIETGTYTTVDYVKVPAGTYGTVLDFEDLERVDGRTLGSIGGTPPAGFEARLAAVEAAVASGVITGGAPAGTGTAGAIKVSDLFDVSAIGISLGTAASAAAARTALGVGTASTKADVGLGNVDNTSDANKPISTATQAALDLKADEGTTPQTIISSGGVYAARPATTNSVFFLGSTAPGADGSTSGGGGMVPLLDLWFQL